MYYKKKRNYLIGDELFIEPSIYMRNMCHPHQGGECRVSLYQLTKLLLPTDTIDVVKAFTLADGETIRPGIEHVSELINGLGHHYMAGLYNKAWCNLSQSKGWSYISAFQVGPPVKHLFISFEIIVCHMVFDAGFY